MIPRCAAQAAILFACAIVIGSTACGTPGDNSSDPGVDARHDVGVYEALQTLELVDERPVCSGSDACIFGPNVEAVLSDGGDILLWEVGRPLYVLRKTDRVPHMIGALGEGPGEYRAVITAALTDSDEILAYDGAQQRLVRFASSGEALASVRVALPRGFIAAGFVGPSLYMIAADLPKADAAGDSTGVALFSADAGGRLQRVADLATRQIGFDIAAMRPVSPLFSGRQQWVIGPQGDVALSNGQAFAVDLFAPDGRQVRRVGFRVEPRMVEAEEVAAARRRVLDRVGNPAMRESMRRKLQPTAARHAAITKLRIIADRFWIREAARMSEDSVRWIVIDTVGTPWGAITLGEDVSVLAGRSDSILLHMPSITPADGPLRWAKVRRRE